MENSIIERIKSIVTAKSKNASDFARKVGKPVGTITSITVRGSKPGPDFLEQILRTFPDIDALWLICGIGEMQSHIGERVQEEKEASPIVEVLQREREVLVSNIEELKRDKERLWTMLLETTGKKQVSNENQQRVVKLANGEFQTAA